MTNKFRLECGTCQMVIGEPSDWYFSDRTCPSCHSINIFVRYLEGGESLLRIFSQQGKEYSNFGFGLWRYFDCLPVTRKHSIETSGEGGVALDRWDFLEAFAAKRGIVCKVYAHRHDNNPSTGTFKDLAGSVVASVLKEVGVRNIAVASTGNIAVALARYMAAAGISLYSFIPESSSRLHGAEIGIFGQKVFRVQGDYAKAKALAAKFAQKYDILLSPGGFDPFRVEAKKTIAFEWMRQLGRMPTVYIQALSGGMSPLGIAKGVEELSEAGLDVQMPRFLLVQADRCAPMAAAWRHANQTGFSAGWQDQYQIIENPRSSIPTLATGNPTLYPFVGNLVYRSGGNIDAFPEQSVSIIARWVASENGVRIGPAAAVAVGGFVKAVREGLIKNNDEVVVAIGEGIRRNPDFMLNLDWSTDVSDIDQCDVYDRSKHIENIRESIESVTLP